MTLDEANELLAKAQTEAAAAFTELRVEALRDVIAIFTDMVQAIDDLCREVVADPEKIVSPSKPR